VASRAGRRRHGTGAGVHWPTPHRKGSKQLGRRPAASRDCRLVDEIALVVEPSERTACATSGAGDLSFAISRAKLRRRSQRAQIGERRAADGRSRSQRRPTIEPPRQTITCLSDSVAAERTSDSDAGYMVGAPAWPRTAAYPRKRRGKRSAAAPPKPKDGRAPDPAHRRERKHGTACRQDTSRQSNDIPLLSG